MNRPLTAAMDNVLAWRLGEIVNNTMARTDVGDYIDRGLILLRLLNEAGFAVHYADPLDRMQAIDDQLGDQP